MNASIVARLSCLVGLPKRRALHTALSVKDAEAGERCWDGARARVGARSAVGNQVPAGFRIEVVNV